MSAVSDLEQSIFDTTRYFDLFDMPVTAVEIWRCLILANESERVRWGGRHVYSLSDIRECLNTSYFLSSRIETLHGYYFLSGKESFVRARLERHAIAQQKWKIAYRAAQWFVYIPFVRMLAGSGSLSLFNTKQSSDLDFFVVASEKRIWTARFLLLIVAQLMGRRRKHWDRMAPDKVCLNHYVTDKHLDMPGEVRNLYTAVAYSKLVPLFGLPVFAAFERLNAPWIKSRLMFSDAPVLPSKLTIKPNRFLWNFRQFFERVLEEPIGDMAEAFVERIQRQAIAKHSYPGQSGRVSVSDTELAFHPDSQVPRVLTRYRQDVGQRALL